MSDIIYPVSRLLANPRVFFPIANQLGGPDADTLRESFYEMLEYGLAEAEDPEEFDFYATEVCFSMDPETGEVRLVLDTGLMSVLKPLEEDATPVISTDAEFAATSAIYDRLISAIVEANPEFSGNIALCSPPTRGNQYLRSTDGDRFEGSFHLLTDPELRYSFTVDIVDVHADILQATYRPI